MSKKKETKGFDLSLEIDRMFEEVRVNLIEFAIQNESEIHVKMIRMSNAPYLYTTEPKRFFVDKNGNLIDKGFKVYFKVNTQEDYTKLKEMVFNRFSKNLFISPKVTSNKDAGFISGFIKFTNLKNKTSN